ncbi:MAG: DUF1254 domain-containing protein [Betaproteobacteria bacterium]|nr:DUF1254 domain-containing protein [Betaproteobacteria bacterium]
MKTMMSESMKKEFGRAMRGIALVGVIAGACPPGAWAQQAEAPGALERRVDAAFEAAFPLYEMARARFNAMVNPLNPAPSPVNGTPVNRRNLIDHTARDVTTPNNDTLYSATWLDLHATPVRIRVPRVEGGRYWSVALLDIFTNNFAILGRQQDGEGPVEVTVVGPQWAGPLPGGRVIRSPSNDVQLVGRFLVDGPADLDAVHRIQDGVRVEPLDRAAKTLPQWVPVRTSTDPENFLAVVNEMLSRNPLAGDRGFSLFKLGRPGRWRRRLCIQPHQRCGSGRLARAAAGPASRSSRGPAAWGEKGRRLERTVTGRGRFRAEPQPARRGGIRRPECTALTRSHLSQP